MFKAGITWYSDKIEWMIKGKLTTNLENARNKEEKKRSKNVEKLLFVIKARRNSESFCQLSDLVPSSWLIAERMVRNPNETVHHARLFFAEKIKTVDKNCR